MDERFVKIYVLKNPETGSVHYVGRTLNEKTRYRQHIYLARKSKHKNRKNAWIMSILNIGKKPILEIIDVIKQEDAIEREMYWISELRKTCDLKNERDFVENNYLYSEESRKRMSEAQKGNTNKRGTKLTEEQRFSTGNGNRGRKQGFEERKKRCKPIDEFDIGGNHIREWESASAAARFYSIKQSAVSMVAAGKRNSWFGIVWKYK